MTALTLLAIPDALSLLFMVAIITRNTMNSAPATWSADADQRGE